MLRPGSDADAVIVEPGADSIIPRKTSTWPWTTDLFAGKPCLGRHRTVLLRGRVAYDQGRILDDARRGVFLPGCRPSAPSGWCRGAPLSSRVEKANQGRHL